MKYWNILLPVSLPVLYFPKLGITVVSCSLLVPRWKGDLNMEWVVEASTALRFCCTTTEGADRTAGSWVRGRWRTAEAAALETDMFGGPRGGGEGAMGRDGGRDGVSW